MKNKTIVNFVLDKSGSMGSIQDTTISGVNEYVNTLKKDKKSDYELSLTLFDTEVKQHISKQPIKDFVNLDKTTYSPEGMTALYDAVCKSIKDLKGEKGKVLTVIMTDGQENSSKEYNMAQLKALIDEHTKKGNWTFVFLGANQDSWAMAGSIGIATMNVSNFNATSTGTSQVFHTMASNSMNFASQTSASSNKFFTQADQDKLQQAK